MEHCLNTGSISTIKASGNIGGLVGIVEIQNAGLNLSDSVSVGKISDASKKPQSWEPLFRVTHSRRSRGHILMEA